MTHEFFVRGVSLGTHYSGIGFVEEAMSRILECDLAANGVAAEAEEV